jgi:hypothetical protein
MKTDQATKATEMRRAEIQLTRRDMRMLSTLETWGVLGIGQMIGIGLAEALDEADQVERYFNKMDRDDYKLGLAARLHMLEVGGYIQGHSFLRQPKAFTLTHKGRAAISDEPESARSDPRNFVSEALIKHDLKVSAVGLVIAEILGLPARREHPQAVWTSSNGRGHLTLEGAADLWLDTPEPKAIEVELTQKSRRRYDEIFETYRRRLPRNGSVLYLTGWPNGASIILRNARDQRAPFVFACALDEFRRTAGRCTFESAVEDRTVTLPGREAARFSVEAAS